MCLRLYLGILLACSASHLFGQTYTGGSGQGFSTANLALQVITGQAAPAYTLGGSGSGDQSVLLPLMVMNGTALPVMFAGGIGRGDSSFLISLQAVNGQALPLMYTGGNGRGDSSFTTPLLVITGGAFGSIYTGGAGRGDFATEPLQASTGDCTTMMVWTGAASNAWENPNNWNCIAVPGPQHTVIIPVNVPRFPRINANTNVKMIFVLKDAFLRVNAGVQILLNGN